VNLREHKIREDKESEMKELEKTYNPSAIEEKIYERWLNNKYFHAKPNRDKKPFTIVMPPPNITRGTCVS